MFGADLFQFLCLVINPLLVTSLFLLRIVQSLLQILQFSRQTVGTAEEDKDEEEVEEKEEGERDEKEEKKEVEEDSKKKPENMKQWRRGTHPVNHHHHHQVHHPLREKVSSRARRGPPSWPSMILSRSPFE